MANAFDIKTLPDDVRLAYYGAMFAIAAVDGEMDRDEIGLIFESLSQEGLSAPSKAKLRSFLLDPPPLGACLDILALGAPELRYGIMVALVDVAIADDIIVAEEKCALNDAQQRLKITPEQAAAIETFCREAKRIRERGLDDNIAAESLKHATSGLTAVGIPIAAVYFSGSVIGLSAAGITSGLAALGLGLGMVPGIGVAILIGVAGYYAVHKLLDGGNKRKKLALQSERERRAQLVIQNLQEAINDLLGRLTSLQEAADRAKANEDAIKQLNLRLRALQQLLAKRKAASA